MTPDQDLVEMAKRIIDGNRYMTLSTADAEGAPWITPVYFSPDRYRDMYWISSPEARHSRNIEQRADVAIVVFNSQAPIGSAEAVYMKANATELSEPTEADCEAAFRQRFEEIWVLSPDQLKPPAELRLYRATVSEHSVLIRGSDPVRGKGLDSRAIVTLESS